MAHPKHPQRTHARTPASPPPGPPIPATWPARLPTPPKQHAKTFHLGGSEGNAGNPGAVAVAVLGAVAIADLRAGQAAVAVYDGFIPFLPTGS